MWRDHGPDDAFGPMGVVLTLILLTVWNIPGLIVGTALGWFLSSWIGGTQ